MAYYDGRTDNKKSDALRVKEVTGRLVDTGFEVSTGNPWESSETVFVTCDRGVVTVLIDSEFPEINAAVGQQVRDEISTWPFARNVTLMAAPDGAVFVWHTC